MLYVLAYLALPVCKTPSHETKSVVVHFLTTHICSCSQNHDSCKQRRADFYDIIFSFAQGIFEEEFQNVSDETHNDNSATLVITLAQSYQQDVGDATIALVNKAGQSFSAPIKTSKHTTHIYMLGLIFHLSFQG